MVEEESAETARVKLIVDSGGEAALALAWTTRPLKYLGRDGRHSLELWSRNVFFLKRTGLSAILITTEES